MSNGFEFFFFNLAANIAGIFYFALSITRGGNFFSLYILMVGKRRILILIFVAAVTFMKRISLCNTGRRYYFGTVCMSMKFVLFGCIRNIFALFCRNLRKQLKSFGLIAIICVYFCRLKAVRGFLWLKL